ncbi:helix-turn-helix domain-containing protein [uncultured Parasphingorhabdus sp.]|uniref:helix-turn-helix domain-containing protein n=1 Tax=uncultured Parasphingorhabdus sp. TaxID=2709694 RepID=UPI002AA73B33|nr:helix-turn-helix domain-containing protein [uncultured Parasphingorhabdus sp.]
MTNPITLSIPDAVRVSGLSRSRVYEALKARELKAVKAGRRTLIPVADLEAYLAKLPQYQAGA